MKKRRETFKPIVKCSDAKAITLRHSSENRFTHAGDIGSNEISSPCMGLDIYFRPMVQMLLFIVANALSHAWLVYSCNENLKNIIGS